ncbi:MAG: ribosome recycling factor, partial [Patescibacteria group bacterium]
MNQYLQQHQAELKQVMEFFQKDIATIRTGRANPAMLDGVLVEAYGAKMPLMQVGNISVVDARCLTVAPWDKNVLKEMEKAIAAAELGVNPV